MTRRLTAAGRTVPGVVLGPTDPTAPLVVLLHGGGGSGRTIVAQSRARRFVARGWRVVAPDGRHGRWRPGRGERNASSDRAWLLQLLRDLVGDAKRSRVMLAGFSNGAMMAYDVGFAAPEQVDVIGAVGGAPLWLPSGDRPVPRIFHLHGALDRRVPLAGSDSLPSPALQLAGVARRRALTWAAAGGHGVVRAVARTTGGDAAIEVVAICGMGHAWPGGQRMSPLSDDPASPVDGTAELGDAFAALAAIGTAA